MNLGDPQVAWVGMLFNGNKRIRLVVLNAFSGQRGDSRCCVKVS